MRIYWIVMKGKKAEYEDRIKCYKKINKKWNANKEISLGYWRSRIFYKLKKNQNNYKENIEESLYKIIKTGFKEDSKN